MKLRKFLLAAAAVVAVAAAMPAEAGQKVRIGYWTSGVSLGFGSVLQSKDFLNQRGIDAEFVHFPDVNAPLRALASGSIDLAFGAPLAGVFSTAAEGVPIKIFTATQPADVQVVVPSDSPIKSISELKGKKIGMSPAGSSVAVIAGTVLSGNYGIKSEDFTLVGGNESRLVQFLAQKQVDAAALRSVTVAQIDGELKVRKLGSFVDEWRKLTKSDALPYNGVGAVSTALITSQPDTVANVIAALRDTLAWGAAHKDEVVTILEKSANLPTKDARVYVENWDAMYRVAFEPSDIASLKRQHEVLAAGGFIKGELNDDLFVTGPYERSKALK
ncbi:ABC transporter substrate-binding protein [Bradyrhizobium sp. Arg237L]|uniref:ABC transporter substrate-binding protein n=1 Tax=Bradyrhizobium sp. Arg237L TaxID=3003352 RepID=UPI00249F4F49|nr:ABC transporter substrate-binding protein [Bradyrhizobium sp. Arg237L]MDI4234013.1 ABC transporter substrate-binding protein [Bradyrhizobium sp. Arg237L]